MLFQSMILALSLSFTGISMRLNAAPAGPDPGERVAEVKFEGLSRLKPEEVRFYVRTVAGSAFSPLRLREDILALLRAADGALKDVRVEAEKTEAGWVMVFVVKEKPKVRTITFKGNNKKKRRELLETSNLAVGDWYDPFDLKEASRKITKKYLEDGFALTRVSGEIGEIENDEVDVVLKIEESSKLTVRSVNFSGSEAFADNTIRGLMKGTRDRGLLRSKKFNEQKFLDDLDAIRAFYEKKGYLEAQVSEGERVYHEDEPEMTLNIILNDGILYRLGNLDLSGNVILADDEIEDAIGVDSGEILNKERFFRGVAKVSRLYGQKGYIDVSVDPRFIYRPEDGIADVTLSVIERERATIEEIVLQGNYSTRDFVIQRELLLSEGDVFDFAKLQRSIQKLYNLQYFDRVEPDWSQGTAPGKTLLILRFSERKTGTVSFGAGYSSLDKIVGFLKVAQINLFGKGQKISGEWEFGKRRTSWTFRFEEPWLWGSRTGFGISVWNTDRRFDIFREERVGGSISVTRRFSDYWRGRMTYSLQDVRIETFGSFQTAGLVTSQQGTTSTLTPFIAFDTRDNYILPRRGGRHALAVDWAGGALGGDFKFIRMSYDLSHNFSLPLKFAIGTHIKIGLAKGFGGSDVPLFEQFSVGGTDTVRGYDERDLGPPGDIWGRSMFITNTELRYIVVPPFTLAAALFLDGGRAWRDSHWGDFGGTTTNFMGDLDWGYGVGVRLMIPGTIMQLRFDYGWPFATDRLASLRGKFHFTLGSIF